MISQHPPEPLSPSAQPVQVDEASLQDQPGAVQFATDQLPWQRSLRWTRPVLDRRLLWLGGLIALLVTVLELVGFGLGMRSYHGHRSPTQAIQVVLIEPQAEPVPLPPEPEPPIALRASRIQVAPPDVKVRPPPPRPAEESEQTHARIGTGSFAPMPHLFNPDGSVRLGTGVPALAPPPATERQAAKERWAEIEKRGNPLDCKKTRFAGAFAPDESAGDKVARKYLKWVGLADQDAIAHRDQLRAESGGCEPVR